VRRRGARERKVLPPLGLDFRQRPFAIADLLIEQ